MALVKVHSFGTGDKGEALHIGGVDPRSCHPITRYVDNPFGHLATRATARVILDPNVVEQFKGVHSIFRQPYLATRHYFKDGWTGHSHTLYEVVSRPMRHSELSFLSRLALVTHELVGDDANPAEDDVLHEALLQQSDGAHWHTVAAIAKSTYTEEEFGFVDDTLLDDVVQSDEELRRTEGDAFLNRLVEAASQALDESIARAVF